MSSLSRRLGNPVAAFFVIVVLPLALVALAIWEYRQAEARIASLNAKAAEIAAIPAGRRPAGSNSLTAAEVREAQKVVKGRREDAMMRRSLARLAAVWAAAFVVTATLLMAAAHALGRAGRRSQAALVRGYRRIRNKLPLLSIVLLVAWPISLAATMGGEVANGHPVRQWLGMALLIPIVPILGCALLGVVWGSIAGLVPREAVLVPGHPVSGNEAPGLWRLVTTLAGRLGVAPPDHILVGLTDDLSVVAGPTTPEGGKQTLPGNTLYVPLPLLVFHGEDEVAALIGDELAHFAGQTGNDGEAFGVVQADIARTLGRHADEQGGTINLLALPVAAIGRYVLDQFDEAAQGWHRHRIFAADAAAASLVSPAAAASALLRREAIRGPIREALELGWRDYKQARATDFTAFILAQVARHGLDDPLPRANQGDPSIRERLAALGQDLSDAMLAEATAPPGPEAAARLDRYLADPAAIVGDATGRFVARGAPWRPVKRG